jgi:hypothetical protein
MDSDAGGIAAAFERVPSAAETRRPGMGNRERRCPSLRCHGQSDGVAEDDRAPNLRTPLVRMGPDGDSTLCRTAEDLRGLGPSETLILPSSAGGCDEFGWAPGCSTAVADVALAARLLQRGKLLVIGKGDPDETGVLSLLERAIAADGPSTRVHRLHRDALRTVLANGGGSWRDTAIPGGVLLELRGRLPPSALRMVGQPEEWMEESFSRRSARAVPLESHLREVEKLCLHHGRSLGLPNALVDVLGLAGLLHDIGKADPAFQALLGRTCPSTDGFLAKSEAGGGFLPGRHEALSVAMAETSGFNLPLCCSTSWPHTMALPGPCFR